MTAMFSQFLQRPARRFASLLATRFGAAVRMAGLPLALALTVVAPPVLAQDPVPAEPPAADASCTAFASNRSAPLEADYSFTIYNLPGAAAFFGAGTPPAPAPFRVRVVCSDGTVGETGMAFPDFGEDVVYTGDIYWRRATPIPIGVTLAAGQSRLTAGQGTELRTSGVLTSGAQVDLSGREKGTLYTSSNPALASVSEAGVVAIEGRLDPAFSARVVMTAQNEGVAGSTVLQVGARGSLGGRILRADGVTPVASAQVSVMGDVPRQQLGTTTTDSGGNYLFDDVGVGSYAVSVTDGASGDMGAASGTLSAAGQQAQIDVRMVGQGTVTVTVQDGSGAPVAGSAVTMASLGGFRDVRSAVTAANGQVVFARALAGRLSVSTRDNATNMVGTAGALLAAGGNVHIVLKLQPVGRIAGVVYDVGGVTALEGVQVRLVSRALGLLSQTVSGADGSFSFDGVTLADAPYTLDAVQDGRVRTRAANLILGAANQVLKQNLVFAPAGRVSGQVLRNGGAGVDGATVTLQSQVGQRYTFTTVTDAQGRYAIDGVPVGAFGLTAAAEGGENGSASGTLSADGESVTVNLQLASSGIVGTVYLRNGSTAAGPGVTVELFRRGSPAGSTTTGAQGQYSFSVSQPDTYSVEARDGDGNRGVTSIVLTSITAGEPKTVNVVFLGRGTVRGSVRDPSGALQPGAKVKLTSASVFGGIHDVLADGQGNYRVDGVFLGDFSVYAHNPASGLAGLGRGRMAEDGMQVASDVTLAATGSVSGKVVQSDGVTAVAGASVDVLVLGSKALNTVTDTLGRFSFAAVPLGDFSLLATNPADGDKGQAVSRLVTANEARSVQVRLLGRGAVRVQVLSAASEPVAGALVAVTSGSQFGGSVSATTGADGSVTLGPVFNGDFTVTAEKTQNAVRLSASDGGTIQGGATVQASLVLANRSVGSVAGVVGKGMAGTPQAGVAITISGPRTQRSMTSGADGSYRFDLLESGNTYQVTATINGRVRARADVRIDSADQVVVRNLSLLGVGTVSGLITEGQNQPRSGARVTLTNADSVYGGSWSVTSQADGSYQLGDIPAGNFVLRATSADYRKVAQDSGVVRFDGDAAVVNMTLLDNAVNMPETLRDANGLTFDIQGNGSLASGTNGVFAGNGGAEVAAVRLDLIVNNVAVPFQNGDGALGRKTEAGQQIEVDELHQASGLHVTRRTFVPRLGYFARHLEVLENRGTSAVTVGVRISSHFARGSVGARVVDTSSGDAVLDVTGGARDRWLIVDDEHDADPIDQGGNPAVAMVLDGATATGASEAAIGAVGSAARLSVQWNNLTLQPGESMALMHFTSQQLGRAAARAAAERLAQLPPEALEGLRAEERLMVRNFSIPADGLSALAPLPLRAGLSITGQVLAGDGVTAIKNAQVRLQGDHPLFGRTYRTSADGEGRFGFTSSNDTFGALTIVQDAFHVSATHPLTHAVSAPAAGYFAMPALAASKDIVFSGTGILRGTVRRHGGALVSSGTVTIPYIFPGTNVTSPLTTEIDGSGAYAFVAIEPGSYLASASQPHPQGKAIVGAAATATPVPAAVISLADITMQETGEVAGAVRAANGEPVVGATVQLDPNPRLGPYRTTITDTGGQYRFTDVSLGGHSVEVSGHNGLTAAGSVTVSRGASALLNLQLAGTGQVRVQVLYARGAPAIGASVGLDGDWRVTDAAGQATFSARSDVPLAARATHPDNSTLASNASVTINGNGAEAGVTLTLPGAGAFVGTVYRPGGGIPAANIAMTLRRQDGVAFVAHATTNASGVFRFIGLPLAPYTVSAEDRVNLKFADAERNITTDGEEVRADLVLADNRIALPAPLYDANDFLFDIGQSGAIQNGWRASVYSPYAVYNNGAQLEINGQLFSGDTSAALEAGRRQFVIAQPAAMSGLSVRRKIFVPRGGYFARYLEILDNPGTSAVTVQVRLNTRMRNNTGQNSVVDTSSGDSTLQGAADTWAVTDDSEDQDPFITGSAPAAAMVVGDGRAPLAHDAFGFQDASLAAGWSAVTVPPQGRVILMHFALQQINRAGARAAATRLQQLPPEALAALSAEEIAAVANFAMPSGGESAVQPLPVLLGRVAGTAYEGDGRTVVPGVKVQMRSTHPLFGRTWIQGDYTECSNYNEPATLLADGNGAFSLAGVMADRGSVALPVGFDVQVDAAKAPNCVYYNPGPGHPVSHIPSRTTVARFAPDALQVNADLVFDSSLVMGSLIGPADYGVGRGTVRVTLPPNPLRQYSYSVSAQVQANGSYLLAGLPPGSFPVTLDIPHDQGTALMGLPDAITVTAGATLFRNLYTETTGSVSGRVLSANATAAVGARLSLQRSDNQAWVSRSTTVDSLGQYTLSAVPVGNYVLTVTDPRTHAQIATPVSVSAGQASAHDMTLLGTGQVRVTVRFAGGTPAGGIAVLLAAESIGGERHQGFTDAQGQLVVAVPVGAYTLYTYADADRYYRGVWTTRAGVIGANNEALDVVMTLGASASVRTTVVDLDAGSAPLANAAVTITDAACPTGCYRGDTNGAGQFTLSNVHGGAYSITARAADGRSGQVHGVIGTADDGRTLERTLGLTAQLDRVGLLGFVGESHLYSIPVNAGDVISVGVSGAAVNGGGSAYLTRVRVFDPAKNRVALGYGYDSRNGNAQYNEQGNLQQITAQTAGNYAVTAAAYYSGTDYLGGYRLQVKVNGVATALSPYLDGAVVQGQVLKGDTTPSASHLVELHSSDVLGLRVRATADALGQYSIAGVPLGDFEVRALDPANKSVMVRQALVAESAGQIVQANLALPKRTTVQLQVAIQAPLEVPGDLYVTVTDAGGTRQEGPVRFDGAALSQVYSFAVFGDQATIAVAHPSYPNATTRSVVQGADGQSVPLTLTLAFSGIQGRLLDSAGAPVPYTYVQAIAVAERSYLGSASSDANGRFLLGGMPPGEEVAIQAVDAQSNRYVGPRVTLQQGETRAIEIRFAGVGQVSGRISGSGGQPVEGAYVSATYIYDELNGYTTQVAAVSDGSGNYQLDRVPVGTLVAVEASYTSEAGTFTQASQLTLQTAGQSAALDLVLPLPSAALRLSMQDADGVALPQGFCYRATISMDSGATRSRYVCSPEVVFANLGNGAGSISVAAEGLAMPPAQRVETLDQQQTEVVMVASVVKGTVRFADGTPVPQPSVSLVTESGESLFASESSDQGDYRIIGVPAGAVSVKAEDGASALYQSASGTLASAAAALRVDVTLPPSGTVSGVFRDGGAVIANATVYVRSTALDVDRYAFTDANGAYRIERVAQGRISVVGRDESTGMIGAGEGVLGAAGLTVDLALPAATSVSGTVTSNGQPISGASVQLSTLRTFGPFGVLTQQAETDIDGRYSFAAAPVGELRVIASANEQITSGTGTALAGSALTLDLQMGNEVRLGRTLEGADTSRYDVGCSGSLGDGGYGGAGDAYDEAYTLKLGGTEFPCISSATLLQDGRELAIGPYVIGSLRVARRVFVPVAGGFARYLESFTNPTAAPVNVTVELVGNLGSDNGTRVVVSPAQSGGLYAVTADSGYDPALGHVFGGAGAAVTGVHSYAAPSDDVRSRWTLTVAPGETASLLHFAVQRAPLDTDAVKQQAGALSTLSQAGMLDGLSAEEKASIKNFKVNP